MSESDTLFAQYAGCHLTLEDVASTQPQHAGQRTFSEGAQYPKRTTSTTPLRKREHSHGWYNICYLSEVDNSNVVIYVTEALKKVYYILCSPSVIVALRYKPEDRGFDFRWCLWYFQLT